MAGLGQNVKAVFAYPSTEARPIATPTQSRDGSLITTASGNGLTTTNGAVLKTSVSTQGSRVLHTFDGTNGGVPLSGIILATDGNYYGTTSNGGSGLGLLFKLTPGGTYAILHEFTGQSDGWYPIAPPVQASDGNLYGTTGVGNLDDGTVYKYVPSTGAFTTIFSFSKDGSQGEQVVTTLTQASDGNLYGTTQVGGAKNCGTIFKVSTSGSLLQSYSFPCGAGGQYPFSPLLQASDGNFYGTTSFGGITNSQCGSGCGTIFKMSGGAVSILYNFSGFPNDGAAPESGLTEGTDGKLYGTANSGGSDQLGTIYQITTSGQYKSLYSFVTLVGRGPVAALLQHTNGKFYGTTTQYGRNNAGSLYSLDMGLGPFIALVRYTGRIGQPVQILGQGLTGSTAVTVNGVSATSFKVVSDTYMTAVVPAGATTGSVVVTTPKGSLTSNHNFRIVQ